MLIMDVATLTAAVNAKCGGNVPDTNDEQLTTILNLILPRIEDAMNVQSLVRGNFTDHFLLPRRASRNNPDERLQLRLTNGFLVENTISVLGESGTPITSDMFYSDDDMGIVFLKDWNRGYFTVSYSSGFEPSALPDNPPENYDPNTRVLQNVPDWIQGIAVDFVVQWLRVQRLSPKVPQNVAYSALENAIRRDVYARVYERYMRPRMGVIWSERMTNG